MAKAEKPNILFIMGDDIGWFNVSAYNLGIMGYRTPNIDRIAKEGALFTDWYAQQSCTAGRAAFLTGQSPIRTGLTKVGLPGADLGLGPNDPCIAQVLKAQGYATGQFGKNHLGDRDEHLPTMHGFDEFFGNLYHLNAEEEPENPDYPKDPKFREKFGPRGVLKCKSDGKGGQKIENTGPLNQQADGNGRRGIPRSGQGLHQAQQFGGRTVVLLLQQHAHARLYASEEGIGGKDRPRPLSRRHGRARRACRAVARARRRARYRRQHDRRLHHRQRCRVLHLARWRLDAVQGREGDQLGRRFPRAVRHPLARRDQAGDDRQRHLRARGFPAHARRRRPAMPTSSPGSRRVARSATRASRCTSTATT